MKQKIECKPEQNTITNKDKNILKKRYGEKPLDFLEELYNFKSAKRQRLKPVEPRLCVICKISYMNPRDAILTCDNLTCKALRRKQVNARLYKQRAEGKLIKKSIDLLQRNGYLVIPAILNTRIIIEPMESIR